ncbi:universal stress protein [Luteimonas fraxinea]|uniref:Universal stress protein n=1 Tax=Luteimonas fraxinea TaxID=2901869 RepID=A0ABS8U9Y0_9GAMM|nr:universal stress protein [Luteimonas fraxinea]MCD9095380.1 universal stress protein [Luteimonas fraxinea]MCD9126380.1 universal stress protein [Luteimonas fraxinea]UHH11406.1 universal stress protein [Luteimonas fraxinea]
MSVNESNGSSGVLLATDRAPRCDRALDRALVLARSLGGTAVAATMVDPGTRQAEKVLRRKQPDWYRATSLRTRAERWLRREVAQPGVAWRVHAGEGDAGAQLNGILDGCAGDMLVVTGPVRPGVLSPTVFGSTVDHLLRRERIALLTVHERVHGEYRHMVVASDFSAPSLAALQRARALFPAARLTVLHGFEVPLLGLMNTGQDETVAQVRAQLREAGQALLHKHAPDAELVVEHGDPARLVQQHVESVDPDLVVVGTHGRGAVYELLVGSVARRIVAASAVDTLLIRS